MLGVDPTATSLGDLDADALTRIFDHLGPKEMARLAAVNFEPRLILDSLQHRDPITRFHLAEARHTAAFESVFRSEFTQATYLARLECRRTEAWMPIATTSMSVIFVEDGHLRSKRVDLTSERGVEYPSTQSYDSARSIFPVDGDGGVQFRNVYYYRDICFAISAIGEVYVWEDYKSVHSVPATRLGGIAVRSVAMGESDVLLVTHTGQVFSWGEEAPSSLKRIRLEGAARSASCGYHHSLVVMEDGTVYTFGLQHGPGRSRVAKFPEKIVTSPLGELHIASTAAGKNHSLAITADGKVLSWGYDVGQLGRPRKGRKPYNDGFTTHEIGFIPSLGRVRSVAASGHTSFAVTTDGMLFVWGKTQFRTWGKAQFSRAPLRVDALIHHVVDAVSIHFDHVVVLTRDGRVIGMDLTSALSPERRIHQYTMLEL